MDPRETYMSRPVCRPNKIQSISHLNSIPRPQITISKLYTYFTSIHFKMCGIPRPSSGHRIAIMFPSPSPSPSPSSSLSSSPSPSSPSSSPEPQPLPAQESYSLFFRESELDTTKAVFRSKDVSTMDSFRSCNGIDLRIEYVMFPFSPASLIVGSGTI